MSKKEKDCCNNKCDKEKNNSDKSCKCHEEGCSCGCECNCGENGCCNGECKCGKLQAQIELLEKQVEENKKLASQYLGTASYYKTQAEDNKKDFERYKERNKNIESEAITKANENVAKKILPIIDNFDQAMAHVSDAEILKGFAMIYSSLVSTLSDIGVTEIVCKDEVLNPELHNCISTEETDDENLNDKIACIYQKGYMFAETKQVIRPATVSVYKAKTE